MAQRQLHLYINLLKNFIPVISTMLVMIAIQFVGAGKSSVLLYSMPIWSSILAMVYLKERPTTFAWMGLSLGMIGLIIIVGVDLVKGENLLLFVGQSLIIIASFAWAISNIYFRLHLQHLPKISVTTYQMLFGTLGLTIAMIFFEWGIPFELNATSIYFILFSGVIASALCFTVWYLLLSLVDIVSATLSSMLVPVFGLLFSALILNEKITVNLAIGSLVIIVGITVAQLKQEN